MSYNPAADRSISRRIPTDTVDDVWLCMGPTCFFTVSIDNEATIHAHIAACYPTPPVPKAPAPADLDHVLNASHGTCYTIATGHQRWRCAYCPSDRTATSQERLYEVKYHLQYYHGVATTTAKTAASREGQEPAEGVEGVWEKVWVLDRKHGQCFVSKKGEKRWKCAYCWADLLSKHRGALEAIRHHLRVKHGVLTTAAQPVGRAGETGALEAVHAEPYLSATGVKKWKCHYCTAEWVAAHGGALAEIHKHVEVEHEGEGVRGRE